MTARESLSLYVRSVRRCLRLQSAVRGVALTLLCALALTVIAVPAAHTYRFSEDSVRWTRLLLFGGCLLALALLVAIPLVRRWSDRRIARFIEQSHPEYRDRLATAVEFLEGSNKTDAEILELLLEDTQRTVSTTPPGAYLDRRRVQRFAAAGAAAVAIVLGLALFGPSIYRYGIGHLWLGWMSRAAGPLYQVSVSPGNITVARRTDQQIVARPMGFQPNDARIFAYFQNGTRWEELAMKPDEHGNLFRHTFSDVREGVRYYVEAAGVRSSEFRIGVAELPQVKRIELTYRYPAYTGMSQSHEPEGGDIRAVKGTQVDVVVHTDIAADTGDLLFDSGKTIALRRTAERQLSGTLTVESAGLYHVRLGRRGEQPARSSDDYFIDALDDEPPKVTIQRPGRDYKPTSIEEVSSQFEAQDDFALSALELRYSVNGAPERQVNLLDRRGARQHQANHTFFLEEFNLAPGDVVSYYALARDARQMAQTDMYFLEVRPFEREYRQAQSGGMAGGGGGEDDGSNLVERQKEIIAATWNLIRHTGDTREDTKTLAQLQHTLKEQTEMLATRVERRALSGLNQEFTNLVQNLRKAAESMGPAADQLAARKLKDALPPEQKALQHLSRAEASFREIQVAFGSNQGGGRGRGGSGRELADLFDLELDTQKNQYETPQQRQSGAGGQRDEKLDAALRRLQELARRQQQIAEQRRRDQQQPAASRWEQEMLRRQTEELAKELEKLARETGSREMEAARQRLEQAARDMQAQSQSHGQPSPNGQQSGAQGQSSGQSSGQNSSQGQQASEAAARDRALQRLQEARDLLARRRGEEGQQAMDRVADQARQVSRDQQKAGEAVRNMPAPGEDMQKRVYAFQVAVNEKNKVLEGLSELERQLHEAARKLQSTQPEVSRKLRGAGNSIREEQLQDKVRQGADMLRRGLNALAQQREEGIQQALQRLEQQIADARRNFDARGGSEGRRDSGDQRAERALARAEDLRRKLEQLEDQLRQQRGRQGQPGQQSGQQSGQQQGQQQGQSAAGQSQGERGPLDPLGRPGQRLQRSDPGSEARGSRYDGGPSGIPHGAWNPGGEQRSATGARPLTPAERQEMERQYREAIPAIRDLQRELRGDPDFTRRTRELVAAMSQLENGRFPGDPAEIERLRASVLDGLRQVELELARRVGAPGELRLPAHEEIPDSYRKQVEQYYRALAQRGRKP